MEGMLSVAAVTELAPSRWLGVFRTSGGDCLAAPFGLDEGKPTRARPGDGAARSLIEHLRSGHPELSNNFRSTSFVDEHSPVLAGWVGWAGEAPERPMLVDQTHESVVVGDQAVVKWAVQAEPTPAPVLIAHLRAAGFKEMPEPWGFVTWADGSDELLVASVVQYLPGATDGWTWAVADAADFAVRGASLESAVSQLSAVGSVVADMHVAMATPSSVIGSPESIADRGQLLRWRDLALGLLREAIDSVDGPEGARLAALGPEIVEAIQELGAVDETTTIPVHGDLHVGQVLRWDGGFALGDFDGNPVLPVTTRLSAQPAARDVAGMLQSIDHVGRVVRRRVEGADPDGVREWITIAQQRFLGAYRERLGECGREALFDDRLMLAFRAEQECREFLYAVRHLPRWRYVPDQALQALFDHE